MKPDDEKPWSVITIQISRKPLTPEMILKYLGTYLEVDGMEFEVMKAPNEHLVIAPEKALQELMKSCFKLNIKLDEFNVILMPLEKFKDKIEDI